MPVLHKIESERRACGGNRGLRDVFREFPIRKSGAGMAGVKNGSVGANGQVSRVRTGWNLI
jgi:hypothetical protein